MADTATVNKVTIGCRYPEDRVDLIDAIGKRRGDPDRAATIRAALDKLIAEHFPSEAA